MKTNTKFLTLFAALGLGFGSLIGANPAFAVDYYDYDYDDDSYWSETEWYD